MNDWFQLAEEQRRMALMQAAVRTNLPVHAVEKDLWVTVVLQLVFTLPIAHHLVFKGGTSLSKVWRVIRRFSEDIDLAVAPSIWGFDDVLTKKQIKRLRKTSSIFVRDELCMAMRDAVAAAGLEGCLRVVADPDGEGDNTYPEPRVLHVYYKSLFDADIPYLQSEVKLEVSARSLLEPTSEARISSFMDEVLPISTALTDVSIPTALAEKTFLEKAFLLHELFSSGKAGAARRRSRHLYDLAQMMNAGIAPKAVGNDELWNSIRRHRELFTSVRGVDYGHDFRDSIILAPPESVMENWSSDYEDMQSVMIYGDKPAFDELIGRIHQLESMFRDRCL